MRAQISNPGLTGQALYNAADAGMASYEQAERVQYSQRSIFEKNYVNLEEGALNGFEERLFNDNYSLFHNTDNDMFRQICTDARMGRLLSSYFYKNGKLLLTNLERVHIIRTKGELKMLEQVETQTAAEEELLDIMAEVGFSTEEAETSLEMYYELGITETILRLLKSNRFQHNKPNYLKLESEIALPIIKRLKSEGKI